MVRDEAIETPYHVGVVDAEIGYRALEARPLCLEMACRIGVDEEEDVEVWYRGRDESRGVLKLDGLDGSFLKKCKGNL